MKITMVQPRLDLRGGAENFILWMSKELARRGHEIAIVTRVVNQDLWRGELDDFQVHEIGGRFDKLLGRRLRTRKYANAVEELVRNQDLVVAHNFPATVWATRSFTHDIPRIWFCHEPMQRLHWQATMPNIRRFAATPSSWDAGVFSKFVAKLKKKQAKSAGFDLEADTQAAVSFDRILTNSQFTADAVTQVYSVPASPCILGIPDVVDEGLEPVDGRYIAWVTSELPYKNARGFIEAVRIAVHELGATDLRIRVIGLSEDSFPEQVKEAKLNEHLIFEGRTKYQRLQSILKSSQFLAYPTVDEPFGLVPLEAMAFAKAVVASNIGGPRETVDNEVNGLSANPLNPTEFATALVRLWNDPELCEKLGSVGQSHYQTKYRIKHFVDRFEELIEPNLKK